MLKFCIKEFLQWTSLLILGSVVLIFHFNIFSVTLFLLSFGTVSIYLAKVVGLFSGRLVNKGRVALDLPCLYSKVVRIRDPDDLFLIIFFENTNHAFVYGNISITDSLGAVIQRIDFPHQTGVWIEGYSGRGRMKGGPPGKSYFAKRFEKIPVTVSKEEDLILGINLDWNFKGWNTHWEREIPRDRKLFIEWYVRAK